MNYAQALTIRATRNYLGVIRAEYEEWRFGEWDDISFNGNVSHVEDPRADGKIALLGQPFVMVETSRYGQTWITLWADPDNAVRYHTNQECAEDWSVARLVDVRDMTEYTISAKAVKA